VLNSLGLWYLADMLERRMKWWMYLPFVLIAATVSILPEAALEVPVLGLSGLVYAQFGLLMVLRRHDGLIAQRFSPGLVQAGLGWLILGIPLKMLDILPIANGAHVMGLLYGLTVGWLTLEPPRGNRKLGLVQLGLVHGLLAMAVVALVFPVWNARYFAWRGIVSGNPADWDRAHRLDPGLKTPWLIRIDRKLKLEDLQGAWQETLEACRRNRSAPEFDDILRQLWLSMESPQEKAQALDALRTVFGSETDAWLTRFRLPDDSHSGSTVLREVILPDMEPPSGPFSLDAELSVPWHVPGITGPLLSKLPESGVDPDDPRSALLGERL